MKIRYCLYLLLVTLVSNAQQSYYGLQAELTIEECYLLARDNYPLIRQRELIAAAESYDLKNVSKRYLPQFSLTAQATYQTDVTRIPFDLSGISIPGVDLSGFEIPTLSKDQYQFYAEATQLIWDGGAVRAAKSGIEAEAATRKMQFEVDMYALRGRINDLYFGILLLDEQIGLNNTYQAELQRNYDRIASYVENGVASGSDLNTVEAEQIAARQQRTELEAMRGAYVRMLELFTGTDIGESRRLIVPFPDPESTYNEINRPELLLFESQANAYDAQRKSIRAKNMPTIALFARGGYGNPGLDMLRDGFRTYAIGGVTLQWNFGNLYTRRNELKKVDTGIKQIATLRDTFLFNTGIQSEMQQAEIVKYRDIMQEDDRLIELRENIRRAAEVKVENGVMSVNDLMREVNSEQSARQSRSVHRIEWLKSIYELKNLTNN